MEEAVEIPVVPKKVQTSMGASVDPEKVSLQEAKNWLKERATKRGARCPCCNQFAKVYKREITGSMVEALILLYRFTAIGEWVHLQSLLKEHKARATGDGMAAMLRYWGLIEANKDAHPSEKRGGSSAGIWRITPAGRSFVEGKLTVPQLVLTYNSKKIGEDGPKVGIKEALGANFNYEELMARR